MARRGKETLPVRIFHELAHIHDSDVVTHMLNDPEIMADEQIGQAELRLQGFQQVQNLRLPNELEKSNHSPYNSEENVNDWADAITTGWEYTCNLFLTTPKICLENDGLILDTLKKPELFGEPNQLGANGDPSGESSGERSVRFFPNGRLLGHLESWFLSLVPQPLTRSDRLC